MLQRRNQLALETPAVGLRAALLGSICFFHPAAQTIVGRAYFSLTGLNDVLGPVTWRALLEPALILSAAFLLLAPPRHAGILKGGKTLIGIGLAVWFAAGAISSLVNMRTELVAVSFFSLFLPGLFVYLGFANVMLTAFERQLVLVALMAGALLPITLGLANFVASFGFPTVANIAAALAMDEGLTGFQEATFGNRGNTAAFVLIVAPLFIVAAVNQEMRRWVRVLGGIVAISCAFSLLITQQRAALMIFVLTVVAIWRFRLRRKRAYLFAAFAASVVLLTVPAFFPDETEYLRGRFVPALTWNPEDGSVFERELAMAEGFELASQGWPVGIGPGASAVMHSFTSAHQFSIQQAMETGLLGLIGSTLWAIGVLSFFWRSIDLDDPDRDWRFGLAIGPASFTAYALLANAPLALGYINTWAVLVLLMIAIAPPIPDRWRQPGMA